MKRINAGRGGVLCAVAGVVISLMSAPAMTATVIEFYNTPLDNYFITSDPVEAAAIDNGAAGPGWARTGDTFSEGGINPVCRFYGSISPGPNSHFYTANQTECDQLKATQAITPATVKRWNFESLDFITTMPVNGVCAAGTVPVFRAYNNGSARGVDSNHRITTSQANIAQVVARGWISEGAVMCGATAASVAATAAFWQAAQGVWTFAPPSTPSVVRWDANGNYIQATTHVGGTERAGMERGRVGYDAITHNFNGIPFQDTDGIGSGLSSRGALLTSQTIAVEGAFIIVRSNGAEALRLTRMANDQATIVGAWALDTVTNLSTQHFAFFADGRYVMIDPVGDAAGPGHPSCGGPGVELGSYTWNGSTGTLTVTGVSVDTNGCAGLNEPPNASVLFGGNVISGIVLSNNGNTMTVGDTVLRRVSQ